MVMTGAVESLTVIVNVDVPVLPALSVAEHETVVVPSANVLPDEGLHMTTSVPSTMSVAAGRGKETTAPAGLVASRVMFADLVTTGAVVSLTVILNVAVPVLPALSVAEHETVVVPSANVLPDVGVHTLATGPSMLSVAVTV
jgi:hypothetical protein